MCPFFTIGNNIDPWISFFILLMQKPIPNELETPTDDTDEICEREKKFAWKMKSIVSRLTYRIFSKYGNLKFVDEKYEEFSKYFIQNYSLKLLE